MPGLARYMSVLRLYTIERPSWTVQAMSDALAVPPSTVYRAVGEMVTAGLLESGAESRYRLGAAFVEFDRLTRLTDPLMRAGQAALAETIVAAGIPCVGLLARLYNGTVMCIADAASSGVDFRSSYERGRPMPLTRGATSKIILAHMPPRRLAALLSRNGASATPESLRAALGDIRGRGFAIARGEIDHGLVGIAAPVLAPPLGVIASLSLVLRESSLIENVERDITRTLVAAAARLTETLRDLAPTATSSTEPLRVPAPAVTS